ncbi:MAG: peptidylprolyl isomerase [Thermoanaerobaculales bacterium]|jgi:parvulin-like peptidyl-prolyl isomerase|nr:peptidylprolyl isomerase [Thermoanaerobaculales bacterium]
MAVRPARRAWFVALAGCAVLACGREDDALARVGEQRLALEAFQSHVAEATGEPWQRAGSAVASRLLDQYLDRKVLLEAARLREPATPVDEATLGPAQLQRLVQRLCGDAPAPDPAGVARDTAARMQEVVPARAEVRQILVGTLEEAQAARRRLDSGADFVALSREISRAPNAAEGGGLGTVFEDSLPPEIEEVVFSLAPGGISRPIQGPTGYHLFQVLELVPAGPPVQAEVEATVRAELAQRIAREHARECVRTLAAEIGVRVNPGRMWFAYDGRYLEGRRNG